MPPNCRPRCRASYMSLLLSSRRTARALSRRWAATVIACIPYIGHAQAPTPQRPAYTLDRYDENWTFLRDPSKRTDFFDPIKWIPIGAHESWFLTRESDTR